MHIDYDGTDTCRIAHEILISDSGELYTNYSMRKKLEW